MFNITGNESMAITAPLLFYVILKAASDCKYEWLVKEKHTSFVSKLSIADLL